MQNGSIGGGYEVYPIELEIGLTNACNHRCVFCAIDYMGYKPVMLDTQLILDNLKELSEKGLKSVIYAGEGEPLIHKDAVEIINKTKEYGIDVAMSTNGVLLTSDISKECLKSLSWIRFSTASFKESIYNKIHRAKEGDLNKVILNMQAAVDVKRRQSLSTTIGVQLLLLPDNKDEIVEMGKALRDIGVDYFTIKPFSQHPQSEQIIQVDYSEMIELGRDVKALETDDFKVYFRAHSMEKLQYTRSYKQCLALPFMVYVDANGNLWPCIVFMGKDDLKYGNLNDGSFVNIWEGNHRKSIYEKFLCMDLNKNCREICRLDEMNKYLDIIKNNEEEISFIIDY